MLEPSAPEDKKIIYGFGGMLAVALLCGGWMLSTLESRLPPAARPTPAPGPKATPRAPKPRPAPTRRKSPTQGFFARYKLLSNQELQRLLKSPAAVVQKKLYPKASRAHYDGISWQLGGHKLQAQLWWSRDIAAISQRWNQLVQHHKANRQPLKLPQAIRLGLLFRDKAGLGLALYRSSSNALLLLRCGCKKAQLLALAKLLHPRLERLK